MSRPLLFSFLASFCAGIAVGELWHVPMIFAGLFGVVSLVLMSFRRSRWPAIIVLGVVLGLFRITGALSFAANDIVSLIGRSVTLTGEVLVPTATLQSAQQADVTNVTVNGRRYTGKLLVTLPSYPSVPTGVRVTATCVIIATTPQSHFRQWSRGIHVRCSAEQLKILRPVHSWRATLGRWQSTLMSYVRRQYNEPQASLLNGILIGNTDGMPDRLNQGFIATGTTHIVALSGFNITIIVSLIVSWLIRLVGRRWAWLPAMGLVIVFVIMCGACASVVRAAVMAVVTQLGLFLGRPISAGRLLAYTVLIMLWFNPLLVFHDLGFQLSFLATIGLVALTTPITSMLGWMPAVGGLRDSLATTISAILMTEPLLLWRFGRLSLIAPLVNMIVVPLIPLSMAIGGVSVLGMLIPYSATMVVPLSDALLRFIVFVITTGADIPMAMVYLAPALTSTCGLVYTAAVVYLLHRHASETVNA